MKCEARVVVELLSLNLESEAWGKPVTDWLVYTQPSHRNISSSDITSKLHFQVLVVLRHWAQGCEIRKHNRVTLYVPKGFVLLPYRKPNIQPQSMFDNLPDQLLCPSSYFQF